MSFRIDDYRRQFNFERTIRVIRGDVPTVRSLAIFTTVPSSSRIKDTLKDALYTAIHVRCGLAENFVVPHLLRAAALHYGKEFQQRAMIVGEKRDHADAHLQFEYWERSPEEKEFTKTKTKSLSFLRGIVLEGEADFYVPFFDDVMSGVTPECDLDRDVTFVADELPTTWRVKSIIDDIKIKEQAVYSDDRYTAKNRWMARGGINVLLRQLKLALDATDARSRKF